MSCNNDTLTFDDKVNGWTSFHSYSPDSMIGMNNRFFTFKNGNLYEHYSDDSLRNNYYETQFNSVIKTIFNESPSDDKIFKTLVIEGDAPWGAEIKTNYTNSTIKDSEFNNRESRYFAYIRGNENTEDLHGLSALGLGIVKSITGTNIEYYSIPSILSVGDSVYQINNNQKELVGVVSGINGNTLDFESFTTNPILGTFCISVKSSRIEGSEVRGYYLEVELENDSTESIELFAINTNAVKSYV